MRKLPKVPWKTSSTSSRSPMEIFALCGHDGVNHWSMLRRRPAGIHTSMIQGRLIPYRGEYGTFSITYRSPQKPSNLGVWSLSSRTNANRNSFSCSRAHVERASGSEMWPSLLASVIDSTWVAKSARLAWSPTLAWAERKRLKDKPKLLSQIRSYESFLTFRWLWIISLNFSTEVPLVGLLKAEASFLGSISLPKS